jgi:hypothetical protein
VLQVASQRAMETDDLLDALLRMGRARHASPHMKASYAYRSEGLVALRPAMPARRFAKPIQ